jgi:hypothetical protein
MNGPPRSGAPPTFSDILLLPVNLQGVNWPQPCEVTCDLTTLSFARCLAQGSSAPKARICLRLKNTLLRIFEREIGVPGFVPKWQPRLDSNQ